ncbi:tetratricopeptide repeat protein [Actinosynnema sp. NPDC059335]|uniref:AfsR/SARP family transcriptional regulator n=1 Tax=Actinosynnema sp. NPDC059335 TaxID=3346804 RepID=UPI00366DA34A
MEFKILGRTRLRVAEKDVDLGTAKQRAVLALLLYHVGQPVPVSTIAQAVWPDEDPSEVRGRLQPLISRLRRVLNGAGLDRSIDREGEAYRLDIDREFIDYHRFRTLAEMGRAKASEGDHVRAKALLREALSLWQGRPLHDVESTSADHLRYQMDTFDRLTAYYTLVESLNALGDHVEAMGEAGRLTQEHELDEVLARLYMRSLEGQGKYAAALEYHERFCERLFEATGAEQGPELRAVYQSIVRKQVGTATTSARPERVPPRQLPRRASTFVGREGLLATLDALLDGPDGGRGQVVALHGMPGVGKTRLAVQWGRTRADRFPDGQLFLDLRGFGRGTAMSAEDAAGVLLASLGVARIPHTGTERAAALHRALGDRQVLLVLDDARHSPQVRPLLAAATNCFTIVTSRTRPWGLDLHDDVHLLAVPPLSFDESIELLRREIGGDRADAEPEALRALASRLDGHPMAVKIIAQHVANQPQVPIGVLVEEYAAQEGLGILGSLDDSDDDSASLSFAFGVSYRDLPTETARVFRLLGLHPTAEFSSAAATALAERPERDVAAHLRTLTKANLLQYATHGRFRLHDLLHDYALDLVRAEESAHQRQVALSGLLTWQLVGAIGMERALNPHDDPVPILPGMTLDGMPRFADENDALAWFATERAPLVAAVPHAFRHGFAGHAWRIAANIDRALDRTGGYRDLVAVEKVAAEAARATGDLEGRCGSLLNLGTAHFRLGEYDEAVEHTRAALSIAERLEDVEFTEIAVHNLASAHRERGDVRIALSLYESALELHRASGHRSLEASTLDQMAAAYQRLDRLDEAVELYREALTLRRAIKHRHGEGTTLTALGKLHHRRRELDEALGCLEEAIEINLSTGERARTVEALVALARVHYDRRSYAEAVDLCHRALDLSAGLDVTHDKAQALFLLGHANHVLGHRAEAERWWRRAEPLLADSGLTEQTHTALGKPDFLRESATAIPDPRDHSSPGDSTQDDGNAGHDREQPSRIRRHDQVTRSGDDDGFALTQE